MLVAQLCPTLCDLMDQSMAGSPVHGILQARILERVAIFFSRGSSRPRDGTLVSRISGCEFSSVLGFKLRKDLRNWKKGKERDGMGWKAAAKEGRLAVSMRERESEKKCSLLSSWEWMGSGRDVRVTIKGQPTSTVCSLLLLTCQDSPMARWPGCGCGHLWMDEDHGK